jgi:MFS family permease
VTATATTPRRERVPLAALLVANYVSWIGNGMTIVAVPLYVLSTTGSLLATGLAGFANALPLTVGGIVGGAVADRLGGRVVSVLADLCAGVLIMLVPLLRATTGLPFGVLLVLLATRTLADTPGGVARLALLEPLTTRAGAKAETANSLFMGAQRIALIVGPVCATLLAQVTSPANVLYIDAVTFGVSAALVGRYAGRVATPPQATGSGFVSDIREGLATVGRTPVVRAIIIVVVVTNFVDDALAPVVLPAYSRDILGDLRLLGLLVAMFGIGIAAGTLLYGPASRRVLSNRFATFTGAFAVIALMRVALALGPGVGLAALVIFLLGLAAGPLNPLITTILQATTPPEKQGRVFGVLLALAFAAAPFGILLQSWLIAAAGITTLLWVSAAVYALTVVAVASSRDLRAMPERS